MGVFGSHMSFHADDEQRPEPVRPAWMKADDALPRILAVEEMIARTDAVAIALSGLWCYANGFEFGLEVLLREPDRYGRLFSRMHHPMLEPGEALPPEFLRVGITFANGTAATNLPGTFARALPDPGRPLMFPSSGSGGGNRGYSSRFWVWPLPPPGPMTVVCEWPHFGVAETGVTLDAQLVLDAAARVTALWD